MGEDILAKIPPLIGGLLRQSTTRELIDFLPFLGQLIHKFKVGAILMRANLEAKHSSIFG
jgi:exportin-T